MTWAFTIAFKAVFEILAIFLTLKTIANAIFQYVAPKVLKYIIFTTEFLKKVSIYTNEAIRLIIDQMPFLYVITITSRATQKPYICVLCHQVSSRSTSTSTVSYTVLSLYL